MASDSVDTPKPDETPTQPEATNPPSLQSDSTSDVEVKPETKDQPPSDENAESSETKNTLSTDDISKLPRELGTVKWFNVKAGYGFIMRASGEDIFIHQTAIINNNPSKSERSVREGEEVEYIVIRGVKGPEVAEVTGPGLVAVLGSDYARNKGDYKGRAMGRQSRVRSYQNRGRNPVPSYRAPPRSGQRQVAPREPYHYQQFSSYPPRNGFRDYPEPMYRDRPYVEHYRDQYRDRERDNANYRERDAQYRDPGYDPTGPRPARNFYSRRITRPIEGDRDREREPGRERDVERDKDPRRRRMPRYDGEREYRERTLDGNTRGEGNERERTRGEGVERERTRGEGVERERTRGSRENRTRGTRSGKQYPSRRRPKRTEDREEKEAGEISPVSSDHNVNSLNDELADLQINGEPDSSEQHNGESAPIVDVKRVEPLASDAPESGPVEA